MMSISVTITIENMNLLNELEKRLRRIINHPFIICPHPFMYADFCSDCKSMLDILRDINFKFSDEEAEDFKAMFNDIDISEFFYTKFSTLFLQIRTSPTTAQASIIATTFAKEAQKLKESIFYGTTYCIN